MADLNGVWIEAVAGGSMSRRWAYRAAAAGYDVAKRSERPHDPRVLYLVRLGDGRAIDEAERTKIQQVMHGVRAAVPPPELLSTLDLPAKTRNKIAAQVVASRIKKALPSRRADAPALALAYFTFRSLATIVRTVETSPVRKMGPRELRDFVVANWSEGDHGIEMLATVGAQTPTRKKPGKSSTTTTLRDGSTMEVVKGISGTYALFIDGEFLKCGSRKEVSDLAAKIEQQGGLQEPEPEPAEEPEPEPAEEPEPEPAEEPEPEPAEEPEEPEPEPAEEPEPEPAEEPEPEQGELFRRLLAEFGR